MALSNIKVIDRTLVTAEPHTGDLFLRVQWTEMTASWHYKWKCCWLAWTDRWSSWWLPEQLPLPCKPLQSAVHRLRNGSWKQTQDTQHGLKTNSDSTLTAARLTTHGQSHLSRRFGSGPIPAAASLDKSARAANQETNHLRWDLTSWVPEDYL